MVQNKKTHADLWPLLHNTHAGSGQNSTLLPPHGANPPHQRSDLQAAHPVCRESAELPARLLGPQKGDAQVQTAQTGRP